MKIIITILTIILSFTVNAQPGYTYESHNLNDLPEEYVIQNQKHPKIYRLAIVIDSTTKDFSKLDILKRHKELTFDIHTEKLPIEFNSVILDSLTEVNLLCNGITKDLTNIRGFKEAKKVNIKDYSGTHIPNTLFEFSTLEDLSINNSSNIIDITALKDLKKIRYLSLDCNSLSEFPNFSKNNPLRHIVLNNVHNNLDFKNLNSLQNLGGIEINITEKLDKFPNYLSNNLKQISINGNILSLENLTLYPNVEYIQIKSTQLERFDVDFKGNNSIKNIGISVNPNLSNIDAVYTCEGLEYLLLNELPSLKEFDLKNLDLRKGLSIQATGITTIKPIEKLKKLPRLYIKYNNYLKIDLETKPPKRDIFDNGKYVKE